MVRQHELYARLNPPAVHHKKRARNEADVDRGDRNNSVRGRRGLIEIIAARTDDAPQ
jgi:hypothetical protein